MIEYRDNELYRIWKNNPSSRNMEALLAEFSPLINKVVHKWSNGQASPQGLKLEAQKLTIKAIETFEENRGAKLSTWVSTYLGKLSRYVAKQQPLFIGEQAQQDYKHYLQAKMNLEDEVGNPPSVNAVADYLGWKPLKVLNMEKMFAPSYNDSQLNTADFLGVSHIDEKDVLYMYSQLDPEEQKLFTMLTGWPSSYKAIPKGVYQNTIQKRTVDEAIHNLKQYSTGRGGNPGLSTEEIARVLHISNGSVSNRAKKLAEKIKIILRI